MSGGHLMKALHVRSPARGRAPVRPVRMAVCFGAAVGLMAMASGSADAGGPSTDLVVSMTVGPTSVTPGANARFPSIITNNGPDDATNVVLRDTIPENGSFVEATPSQGSCGAPDGGVVTCALGGIGAGLSAEVDVVLQTPSDPARVMNEASAAADQPDPNPENNQASAVSQPCGSDCTGGWVDEGGTIHGPPLGGDVTQSATLTAPPSVSGVLSSNN
jgi:uncharacterized repeat protein (TIGR01451 family)